VTVELRIILALHEEENLNRDHPFPLSGNASFDVSSG